MSNCGQSVYQEVSYRESVGSSDFGVCPLIGNESQNLILCGIDFDRTSLICLLQVPQIYGSEEANCLKYALN